MSEYLPVRIISPAQFKVHPHMLRHACGLQAYRFSTRGVLH
jgi:hypothetical protein